MRVTTAEGHLDLEEGQGRCQGEGCRRKGGGMLRLTETIPLGDGIEHVETVVLCGHCMVIATNDRLKPNAERRGREQVQSG